MKTFRLTNFVISFLILLSLCNDKIFAQLSAYQGIVLPYDSPNKVGQSLGGATVAVSDFVADVLRNPAGISFLQHPQFLVSFNQSIYNYKVGFDLNNESIPSSTKYSFNPGYFSGSIPLNFLKNRFVMAASINKIQSSEIELIKTSDFVNSSLTMQQRRKGNVWNATLGISAQPVDDFSIGVSWTKWLGTLTWHDAQVSQDTLRGNIFSDRELEYVGSSFNVGLLKQFNKLSIGLVLYSPFTLMKSHDYKYTFANMESVFDIEQHFNGAAKIGVAYRLGARMTVALDYRFQNKFSVTVVEKSNTFDSWKNKYGSSHKIAIAGEYTLNFNTVKLPIFFAYQAKWTPEVQSYIGRFQPISENGKPLKNDFTFGFNLLYHSFGFHFTAQWNRDSVHIYDGFMPPTSCIAVPGPSFEATVSDVLISFGTSVILK